MNFNLIWIFLGFSVVNIYILTHKGFPGGLQEMQFQSLGRFNWEDPLKKEMATHSSILAWEIPWTEEPGRLQSSQSVSSVTQLCLTLCDSMNCSMPGLPVHHQLPESTQPMSIELIIPSNHLTLCRPLLLLPSIFPSIRDRKSWTWLRD